MGGCHGYPSLFAFSPHFAHCLLCCQLAPTLHYQQVKTGSNKSYVQVKIEPSFVAVAVFDPTNSSLLTLLR